MNDYDDSEDYSSANSFRARSNTWPLNRPDLTLPGGVCIDEPLPEIELEEDDLFTTNENWSTGLVDHDIMSWDPILNNTNQYQQPQQHQSSTIHHHHHHHQQQQQQQAQHHAGATHQRQPSMHQHHHQPQQHPHQQHQNHNLNQQHPHHETPQQQQQPPSQQHEPNIMGPTTGNGPVMVCNNPQQQHQQQQQQQHIHQQTQIQSAAATNHHQTLNGPHYLDTEDPSDYQLQQLHHLSLDNQPSDYHYVSSSISPNNMCGPQRPDGNNSNGGTSTTSSGTTNNNNVADSYSISSSDHQHNLQPLTSARYDLDPQCEADYKNQAEALEQNHLHHHQHHQHNHHHHQPQTHHQHHQHPHHHHSHHQHPHQLHQLTSSNLDNHQSSGSHVLSSSLSTSGICLSGDLEDLDYKSVDPSTILQNPQHYEDQLPQDQLQLHQSGDLGIGLDDGGAGGSTSSGSNNKQSSSTTSSKTKLNTPRRNAWGNMSYADLISQAINSTNDKRLTLSQIYEWMVQHVPYFKDKGDSNSSAGWKNSVRHNLSLHSRFKRLQNEGTGKSSWWTINPEANVGKCARRRAASMEASKFEKKRGRAKKRAEAVRQGLISYPSLTNSSLNGSTGTLESQIQLPPHQPQSTTQYGPHQQSQQPLDQFEAQQQQQSQPQQQQTQQPLQSQSISQFNSEQQQQQIDGLSHPDSHERQPNTGLYVASSIKSQYELDSRYTIVMSK